MVIPMKTFTSILVAAALIAPSMAAAQRHTTPGTAERHAQNLAAAKGETKGDRDASQIARDDQEDRELRVPAAKTGKVNTAAPAARDGATG